MTINITTNYVPRSFTYGYELTPSERERFDYDEDTEEFSGHSFIRYKGHLYDFEEFRCCPDSEFDDYWHGYASDSFYSGVLIHLSDDGEDCVMGTYICGMDD